jgi:hypothetical protein
MLPELLETPPVVSESKGFYIGSVWTTPISKMSFFPHISSHNKRFSVDSLKLFWFNRFHGYTPFFGLDLTNLPIGPNQKRV